MKLGTAMSLLLNCNSISGPMTLPATGQFRIKFRESSSQNLSLVAA